MFSDWRKVLLFIVGIGLLYFPLFLRLDFFPFRMWDEARPAIQAYEMYHSGNYLVTTVDGHPDMWYTKPPLLVWLQVFFIHILGYNELAIRLPSALAALGTCLLIVQFFYKHTRTVWFGWIAALILVTLEAYVSSHGSRTGDVDVPLTFFMVLAAFSLFNYLDEGLKKHVYLFFFALIASVLLKGVAGLFLMPAFLLFILIQKKFVNTLKDIHFYIGLLIGIIVIGSFYYLREDANPGYLKAVWANELLGRYGTVIEGHKGGFWFYFFELTEKNVPVWVYLFPVGLFVGLFNSNPQKRKIAIFCSLIILQYFLLISWSETKTYWYDIPLYPFCAIMVAFIVEYVHSLVMVKMNNGYPAFILLFMIFCMPYNEIYKRVSSHQEPEVWDIQEYAMSYYLQDAVRNKTRNLDGISLCFDGYEGHFVPYKYLLAERGEKINLLYRNSPNIGSKVLAHQEMVKKDIEATYRVEVLDSFRNVRMYHIVGLK